jgi:hypothetical protein
MRLTQKCCAAEQTCKYKLNGKRYFVLMLTRKRRQNYSSYVNASILRSQKTSIKSTWNSIFRFLILYVAFELPAVHALKKERAHWRCNLCDPVCTV